MKSKEFKLEAEAIRNLVIKDELNVALLRLITLTQKADFLNEAHDSSIILSSRLKQNKKEETRGTVSQDDRNVEVNRIRVGILEIINEVENKTSDQGEESVISNKTFPNIDPESADKKEKKQRKPIPKVPAKLIESIKEGKVIPMIGAGLSISAVKEDSNDPMMPTYSELLNQLYLKAEELGGIPEHKLRAIKEAIENKDTKFAAREIRDVFGGGGLEFYRALREILYATKHDTIKASMVHKLLRILDFDHIITTNYDRIMEKLVCPNHEVITPHDSDAFHLFTESAIGNEDGNYLLKMHGDISKPRSIFFGEDELKQLYSSKSNDFKSFRRFIYDIFTKRTILFLGFSFRPESEGYVNLFYEFLKEEFERGAPQRHYALVPKDESMVEHRRHLAKTLNIVFLEYEPDDKHTQVWEFITYLNTSKIDEPVEGKSWSQWYLPNQREHYLDRQLFFEKKARSVRYLTPSLTNAIATDLHLTHTSYKKIIKANLIPDNETSNIAYVRHDVIPKMFDRRDNLEYGMKSKRLEVRIMFLKDTLENDFKNFNEYTLDRYKYFIALMDDDTIDLEVRLLPNLKTEDLKKEDATFALILGAFPKPNADVALAYASQATNTFYNIHMIEANTETTQEKVFQFERYWASAISEQESEEIIKELFNKATLAK